MRRDALQLSIDTPSCIGKSSTILVWSRDSGGRDKRIFQYRRTRICVRVSRVTLVMYLPLDATIKEQDEKLDAIPSAFLLGLPPTRSGRVLKADLTV